MQERLQEVGATLIADCQPPVGQQPGQGALDLPAVAAQPSRGLDATPGDPGLDPSATQVAAATAVVVGLMSM
jgi:hypothetical protein